MRMTSAWRFPRVLAHRGGGTRAPENTLAGFRCGLAYGFHAVEFDVMLAHDGVPVVIHDAQLGRTVAGTASIATLGSRELMAMDAGAWFADSFRGELVPTYRQVVDFCRTEKIWMNVEIKPTVGAERETGQVVARLTREWLANELALPPLLSSFSMAALRAAKVAAPEIARAWLVEKIPADWQQRLREIDAVALHVNQKYLRPEQVAMVKSAGYGVFCYTVNTVVRAGELLDWGVDAFCTDRIDLIQSDFAHRYLS
jgi:glycerophosphoryl diester phosphodiesterase